MKTIKEKIENIKEVNNEITKLQKEYSEIKKKIDAENPGLLNHIDEEIERSQNEINKIYREIGIGIPTHIQNMKIANEQAKINAYLNFDIIPIGYTITEQIRKIREVISNINQIKLLLIKIQNER